MTMNAYRSIKACTVCESQVEFLCQRCREPYCSYKCQELDWPNHKSICIAMSSLMTADPFKIQRKPNPLLLDILSTKHSSQTASLGKPKAPNNSNFPLKTEVNTFNKTIVIQKPAPLVRTIYNDQSEAIKNAPTVVSSNSEHSVQLEPHFSKGKTMQVNETSNKGDPILNSPGIRPMTIPKPVEIEDAPTPITVEAAPLLEMKKPPNSPEIRTKTIPKPIVMEEAPKPLKVEAPQKPLDIAAPPKQVISSAPSTLAEAWMTLFPIDDTGFVGVVVQFTPKDCSQTVWVMIEENEAVSMSLLRDINKNISAAPNVKREDVKVNQLYRVKFEGIYYRGVVLEPVTSEGLVLVRLIDYGNELNVPMDSLKEGIPSMNKLNALGFQIKFQTPREVAIGDKLKIQVKSTGNGNIMNVLVEGEVAFPTKDDLEIVPIPVGTKTKLYCLDYSNIRKGYVAACVYDTKTIGRLEAIGANISDYCAHSNDGYTPQLNELCLALYEDGEWYRAIVGKIIDSNTFGIVFVDYGNMTVVKSSNIRKMPDQFMHKCLLNKCFIKGAPPEKLTENDVKKIVTYLSKNRVFTIESATKENAGYLIKVAELQCDKSSQTMSIRLIDRFQ